MRSALRLNIFSLGARRGVLAGAGIYLCACLFALMKRPDFAVLPYFLFAILIATWNAGGRWGAAFALFGMGAQLVVNALTPAPAHSLWQLVFADINLLVVCAAVAFLTAHLRSLYEREHDTARIDHLTRVLNRKGFEERLEHEIARHERNNQVFCVASLDCDGFKAVNDRFGHAEGDLLLKAIARTTLATVRRSDIVSRLGGDEFTVLFPETNAAQGLIAISKLHDALNVLVGERWGVTFSVGQAIFQELPSSAYTAMGFADALMYRAKRAGKNSAVAAEFGTTLQAEPSRAVGPFTRLAEAKGFHHLEDVLQPGSGVSA
jgi:diguanylate cyclase (GGDEF)-like protein